MRIRGWKQRSRGRRDDDDRPRYDTRRDHGFIHTGFVINSESFEFRSGVDEKKAEQARFLEEVVQTREFLERVYRENNNSLIDLSPEVRTEIAQRGITPIDYGGESPGFILASDPVEPKQLFYVFTDGQN